MGLGPLPILVFNQLVGKRDITCIAGIPINVLLSKQLNGLPPSPNWHIPLQPVNSDVSPKGRGGYDVTS